MGKSPNSSLSFRYNANNEELEELFDACEDDPPTPQFDAPITVHSENASPKRGERTTSILDKYFKSIRSDKVDKTLEQKEDKPVEQKVNEDVRNPPKEVSSSPMKEYLNRLGKRSTSEPATDVKEGTNETWKLFHDFKFKIAQAVEDMKTRSLEETKEKSVPRDNSISDSEENSAIKDSDQSVGDTDNQVSSLDSSIQNLSEMTQPLTAKATEREVSLPNDSKKYSDSSDDTHKNIGPSETADLTRVLLNEGNMMEVESGIEALEDGIDGFSDVPTESDCQNKTKAPFDSVPVQPSGHLNNFGLPPSKSNLQRPSKESTKQKNYFFNFSMYFLTFLVFLNYILFPNSNIWNGFMLGIWFFCFASNFKQWFIDNYFGENDTPSFFQLKRSSNMPVTYTIPSVKEHRPIKKYEGWINHYRFSEYDPYTYHINKTTTAFMKLEGCNLRISYTKSKIPKRALWDEKIEKVEFYQHRLYNLTGARVILLPKGIVRRRQWSKKYPICIILSEKEKIQVLEKENAAIEKKLSESPMDKKREQQLQHEVESTETNTSPEKKKKFVWRRKEKGIAHSDGEAGKEGLRHRLVRKMHRDKKTDSVSTCTEPPESQIQADKNMQLEDASPHDAEVDLGSKSVTSTKDEVEDELDEPDYSRIKEFLESEMEASTESAPEGEWSVHVKHSKDKNLFVFARTGRDKHEWFRRLMTAISDANSSASAELSPVEDKSGSETAPESKDGIEMAVYKLSEKDTVAFAKAPNAQKPESLSESITITSPSFGLTAALEDYEKTFWPFLLKIIQTNSRTPGCECRMLPAEVTWLNTVMARLVYDITRDSAILSRLQTRVQKKLHTLKLPSFMSPLVVTELSLAGACPLVERVSAPAWDERGVWLDADLRYDGGAYISVLTQINLMKLKEKNITLEEQLLTTNDTNAESDTATSLLGQQYPDKGIGKPRQAVYDSEMEDSAESSSDDESPPVQPVDSSENISITDVSTTASEATASSKKKFLRMVDKIATNKYFQQVTDYKYVKRAMEGLSNTDIKLQLEVHGLEGRLALNLPPPPHDRIWIGFRTNPQLVLKARPAVGARTLRFAHISNWIEQKLSKEFEKVLVLPNMEDIVVEVMTPTPVEYE